MDSIQCTTSEFAGMQDMDYGTANGLLHFLRARGLCKLVEKKVSPKSKTGKGKRVSVWEVPVELKINLMYRPESEMTAPVEK